MLDFANLAGYSGHSVAITFRGTINPDPMIVNMLT